MISGFITLPTVGDMITSTTDYATGIFTNLLPIALAIAGLVIGVVLVRLFVIKGLLKAVKKLTGKK